MAYHKIAKIYFQLKDYDKTIEICYKTLEIKPDDILSFNTLFDTYADLNDVKNAYRNALLIFVLLDNWVTAEKDYLAMKGKNFLMIVNYLMIFF